MEPQNIGELIDLMIRLAVENPKVLDETSKEKDAVEYRTIRAQLVGSFELYYHKRWDIKPVPESDGNLAYFERIMRFDWGKF